MDHEKTSLPKARSANPHKKTIQEGSPPTDADDKEFRDRLDTFYESLKDESVPPATSPLRELREILGLSRLEAAGLFYYSYTRWCSIEDGGASFVPNSVTKILKSVYGPGAGAVLEKAWKRYRENMAREIREEVERKLYPAGPSYGMAP